MSALSYYFERAGLMTTGISLVRENTASMQPPRSLWVSFPLGRPLGLPGDARFQMGVIRSALALYEHDSGPILEDYSHDVPAISEDAVTACPVSFPKSVEDNWLGRLQGEFDVMQPWYEISLRRRGGRTLVGVSDLLPAENMAKLAGHLDQNSMPKDVKWLKSAVEDLKAFYLEAMSAQPGDCDSNALFNQFWRDSVLGAAILKLCDRYQTNEDPRVKLVARMLAPREAVGAVTGPDGPTIVGN